MNDSKSRRGFLSKISFVIMGSIPGLFFSNGCSITGLTTYHYRSNDGEILLPLSQHPELNIKEGGVQIDVEDSSVSIVVVRLPENNFIALSPICSHLGCTVRKEGSFFRCPCHGSTYSLTGNVVRGPAEQALKMYRTEYKNNSVLIYLQ
ncbi:MAG TPA: Rieske (2Fe-2S) protein [Bacteroidota bacterium]|nr:Rieske (2Fe-2S) protein [Bacteroidota bacterium]